MSCDGVTSQQFDDINLHDSMIAHTDADRADLVITLGAVRFAATHACNPYGVLAIVRDCTLVLHHVEGSAPYVYDDSIKKLVSHPHPSQPLIGHLVEARVTPSSDGKSAFFFAGWDDRLLAWVEWTLLATGFTLRWHGEVAIWGG